MSVFSGIDELHVCFFVISLECLQTLLSQPLNMLMFFLFGMSMEVEDSTTRTQTEIFVLGNTIDCDNLPSMPVRTDDTELFGMVVFGAAFTLKTLFPLQLFGYAVKASGTANGVL